MTLHFIYAFFCCLLSFLSIQHVPDNLKIKVSDKHNKSLYGAYVINKSKHYLLGTTDEAGVCYINNMDIAPDDSIQISLAGFKDSVFMASSLPEGSHILLQEKTYELEEVLVKDYSTAQILKNAVKVMQQHPTPVKNRIKYHGNGQYEKITECQGRSVEYRKEFGHFFTSGNVQRKNKTDNTYLFTFVPAYVERSFPLTADGKDTLTPLYMYYPTAREHGKNYNSGISKIYSLIRAVEIYGPLFSDNKMYDFRLIDNTGDYVFEFKSKRNKKMRIFCTGEIRIDPKTFRPSHIKFHSIEYQLVDLFNVKEWIQCPYSTEAEMDIRYDTDGFPYIARCIQQTNWKINNNLNAENREMFALGDFPSRRNPANARLVEKEALKLFEFSPLPSEMQKDERYSYLIGYASRSNSGGYKPEILDSLPSLLDAGQALKDLDHYMDIRTQFKKHDARPYYGVDYYLDNHTNYSEHYMEKLDFYRKMITSLYITKELNSIEEVLEKQEEFEKQSQSPE